MALAIKSTKQIISKKMNEKVVLRNQILDNDVETALRLAINDKWVAKIDQDKG